VISSRVDFQCLHFRKFNLMVWRYANMADAGTTAFVSPKHDISTLPTSILFDLDKNVKADFLQPNSCTNPVGKNYVFPGENCARALRVSCLPLKH